jgi:ubiquinone/menaquinone biosynthesis C-methylase UbiE
MGGQKDKSRRYHDRVARRYDAIYDDPYWELHDALAWDNIKPHLPTAATAHCIDLGCGTGKWGLKLLKSGFHVTFLDHSAGMIEEVRQKLRTLPKWEKRSQLVVADITSMKQIPTGQFDFATAMGDPLSICSSPKLAMQEFARILKPGATIVATADNLYAAIPHFVEKGDLDGLESLLVSGRTRWLTDDPRDQFELTTFTPTGLRKLFQRFGFEVLKLAGVPVIPARRLRPLLKDRKILRQVGQLEKRLAMLPCSAAVATHLHIVARAGAAPWRKEVSTSPDSQEPATTGGVTIDGEKNG